MYIIYISYIYVYIYIAPLRFVESLRRGRHEWPRVAKSSLTDGQELRSAGIFTDLAHPFVTEAA